MRELSHESSGPAKRMKALCEAARMAAEGHTVPSVLRGAPTHSGAALLNALDELGWQLIPKFPEFPDEPEDDDGFDDILSAGPTIGYCSKCGEARQEDYVCRKGGATEATTRKRESR